MQKPPLLVIQGPTSSGKTAFSITLAKQLKKDGIMAEIVSADSRQVYKGLDLLSGKVTKKEMAGVPHHMLDIANPKRVYSVAEYKKDAEKVIAQIHKHGHLPILVGGTGLYIDAIVYGTIFPEVPPNKELRKKLGKLGAIELFKQLQKLDPTRAKTIDKANPVRLIRAIEIAQALGKVPKVKKEEKYETLLVTIDLPDEELKKKIHARLLSRVKQGMLAEAKQLHTSGISYKRMEELGLECRYSALYLQEKISKKDMLKELENAIWHYAKRQRTWFKKKNNILD